MENSKTTSTTEIDANGGWIVEHFTQTWDVRHARASYEQKLADAKASLAVVQAEVDAATANLGQFDTERATIVAKEAASQAVAAIADTPIVP